MSRIISGWILKLWGFKIIGEYPYHIKKLVLAVAPHTSAWDVPLGILVRKILDIEMNVVAKHTLFWFPLGNLLRWLGIYPLNRKTSKNYVEAVVKVFEKNDRFAFVISPEGTRKKVEKFKTGFYYIAKGANVPILLVSFDFKNKIVKLSKPFYPTSNFEEDLNFIHNYFRGVKGKYAQGSFD